jgi:NAD(P)-dependent dehydrogenase (short-subunit alcohol dehydrogenase family)
MNVKDKIAVVTGAGSGIGRALVEKFVSEGARQVVAVDINAENARQTADDNGCIAMTADVSRDEDIKHVIEETENNIGPIDLFCSNGGGYFLNTASAAGLLNQIGGAAYGVSKHAAVGFGEWLALTYAHQGIKVSMLCPQAVRTGMTVQDDEADGASATKAAAGDGMMEPEELADIVIEGLERESFLILTHPEVETYMQRKTADYDRWIKGMNRLHLSLTGE